MKSNHQKRVKMKGYGVLTLSLVAGLVSNLSWAIVYLLIPRCSIIIQKNNLVFRSIFINYYTWLSWKYHFPQTKNKEIKTVWWSRSNSCIEVQIAKYTTTALRYESEDMFKISYQFNDMVWTKLEKVDTRPSGPFLKF